MIQYTISPGGIAGFTEDAIRLADRGALPTDIVVLCTGYDSITE